MAFSSYFCPLSVPLDYLCIGVSSMLSSSLGKSRESLTRIYQSSAVLWGHLILWQQFLLDVLLEASLLRDSEGHLVKMVMDSGSKPLLPAAFFNFPFPRIGVREQKQVCYYQNKGTPPAIGLLPNAGCLLFLQAEGYVITQWRYSLELGIFCI